MRSICAGTTSFFCRRFSHIANGSGRLVTHDSELIFNKLSATAMGIHIRIYPRNMRGICAGTATFFCRRFSHIANGSGRLEGKVAVITGAASGIGKATATSFIHNGAKVVIADVNTELGHAAAKELGSGASFIQCDVTKESDISNAVDLAVKTHGHLDIMYNNAGVACKTPPSIVDLDLSVFDRTMAINLRGMVAGIKHAARVMIPRKKCCILCTASVTGILGGMAQHTYSVSKFAVAGLVKSVASEMSRHGIRVNCISPFAVPTRFVMEELKMVYPEADDVWIQKMLRDTGELRGAECQVTDIANAALYLASDDAKYVSGHNLVVDGGFTAFKRLALPLPDQI